MKSKNKESRTIAAVELGSIGGKATAKKHGKAHMSDIGRKGALKRWGK